MKERAVWVNDPMGLDISEEMSLLFESLHIIPYLFQNPIPVHFCFSMRWVNFPHPLGNYPGRRHRVSLSLCVHIPERRDPYEVEMKLFKRMRETARDLPDAVIKGVNDGRVKDF
jgi:hypothetical protein